ncbi:MAG: hypothetical protein Q8L08_04405 [Candidatus Nanopelagicaceae bacterium]|nr:hypothetical protein [Candidatus Nanopelagicaceae bacterium]
MRHFLGTILGMAPRIQAPVVRRTSLPLTEQNERDLSKIRESPSYQIALEQLSGTRIVKVKMSEAALLHAIFEAGIAAVRQKAELASYAEIASSLSEVELKQHRDESRSRRPSWSEDE